MILSVPPKSSFHGFQIHALPRDLRRLLVLLVNLQKPRCFPLSLGHRLLAIGLSVLDGLGGAAARLRNDLVGVV